MDCLSIICLSSLYIEVESGYQQIRHAPAGTQLKYDRNNADPWLTAFSFGLKQEVSPKFTYSVYFRHESMPVVYDYGVNALWVSVEWRPFNGR